MAAMGWTVDEDKLGRIGIIETEREKGEVKLQERRSRWRQSGWKDPMRIQAELEFLGLKRCQTWGRALDNSPEIYGQS